MRRRDRYIYSDRGRRRQKRRRRVTFLLLLLLILLAAGGYFFLVYQNPIRKGTESLKAGDYKEAITYFEKAVAKDKNASEAYRGMGIACFETEDYEKALSYFDEAIGQGAEKTDTLYRLMGTCHMKLSQYEEAAEVYSEGLAGENIEEGIRREMSRNRIAAYEKAGDWEQAKNCMDEYLAQYPEDEEAKREAEFLKTR